MSCLHQITNINTPTEGNDWYLSHIPKNVSYGVANSASPYPENPLAMCPTTLLCIMGCDGEVAVERDGGPSQVRSFLFHPLFEKDCLRRTLNCQI